MDGLEKITARISADADAEIQAIRDKAQAQAEELLAQARAQAEKEKGELLARGRRSAEERKARLISAAQMEGRKMSLAAKQEVLDEAFRQALEEMCSLPEEQYIQLLARLAVQASSTGREQLIFSPKDRTRIGKAVVMAANDALVKQVAPELPDAITDSKVGAFLGKVVNSAAAQITGTGLLTLSEETRPIRGGFIMVDGPVEVNCAFEAMVRAQREQLEKPVAEILFQKRRVRSGAGGRRGPGCPLPDSAGSKDCPQRYARRSALTRKGWYFVPETRYGLFSRLHPHPRDGKPHADPGTDGADD